MMGLPSWMHWICWLIDATFSASISIFIAVLLICVSWNSDYGSVLQFSDGGLIYLFFFLYAVALIVFLFAVSTLFNSRKYIW